MRKMSALFAVLVLAISTSQSQAAFEAVTLTPNPSNTFNNGFGYSVGFRFQATAASQVVSLGYFDSLGDGLVETHAVGLYSDSGTLLASTTVTNSSSLTNLFRYQAVTPVSLVAGQFYRVAGTSGFVDAYTFTPTTFSTDSRISFESDRYAFGNTLAFPTGTDHVTGYFGANFQLNNPNAPSAVPAPAGLLLGLTGLPLVGIAGWVRRRRAAIGV